MYTYVRICSFSTSSLREKCYGHSDTTHDLHEAVNVNSYLCVTAGTTGMATGCSMVEFHVHSNKISTN